MKQNDSNTKIEDLVATARLFVKERDWEKYHNPKDLAESICIEAAELLQLFQWTRPEESVKFKTDVDKFARIKEELADVMIYCLSMANTLEIDLTSTIIEKLENNKKKYPVKNYKRKAPEHHTRIAFVGWGSLTWNSQCLRIIGSWEKDGPLLPIEFARISKNGRLTLVLYPQASEVQTLWVRTRYTDLQEAINSLACREQTSPEHIGYVSIPDNHSRCKVVPRILHSIRHWAEEKRLDAVVWTDLPSKFQEKTKMEFTEENVIKYLRNLKGETLHNAKNYIQKVPKQIKTKIRSRITKELGW